MSTPSQLSSSTVSKLSPSNLLVGAGVSLFEVTTLGQPLEVLKTHMAANRSDGLLTAIRKTYARGGMRGFYQGLVPWAWIESGTTGAILIFTSSIVEDFSRGHGVSAGSAGLLGGIAGGVAQAYLAMGVCTCMKTAEITRNKELKMRSPIPGHPPAPHAVPSTWQVFMATYREGGIRAINKGVNAVALRQATNWGSRMGIARAAETVIRDFRGLKQGSRLSTEDKILASAVGGALGAWNHPIEVVRVEMQSLVKTTSPNRPAKPTIVSTFKYVYNESGIRGLFRGLTPRVLLGMWRTVCLVTLTDYVKIIVKQRS